MNSQRGAAIVLLRALPALAYVGLTVYATIDCRLTPIDEVPVVPRGRWLVVILLVPVVGAVAWLIASRPSRGRHGRVPEGPSQTAGYGWTAEGLAQYPIGPDDDPDFLAGLGRAQRERLLTRMEEDRRRRREQERRLEDPDPDEST